MKKSVLLIDDGQTFTAALEKKMFGNSLYTVDLAGNGLHALQKLKSGKPFDLIVFAMGISGVSASDLLKTLRLKLRLATPVMVIAAAKDSPKLKYMAKLQISGIILQPCEIEKAMGQIGKILGVAEATGSVTSEIFLDRLNEDSSEERDAA